MLVGPFDHYVAGLMTNKVVRFVVFVGYCQANIEVFHYQISEIFFIRFGSAWQDYAKARILFRQACAPKPTRLELSASREL